VLRRTTHQFVGIRFVGIRLDADGVGLGPVPPCRDRIPHQRQQVRCAQVEPGASTPNKRIERTP